ncbi:MAG: hypothetical protein R3B93_14430 [Bacteroidia bacterium]
MEQLVKERRADSPMGLKATAAATALEHDDQDSLAYAIIAQNQGNEREKKKPLGRLIRKPVSLWPIFTKP